MNEVEKRTLGVAPVYLRKEDDTSESRTVEGYAALFDSVSDPLYGGFVERIAPGAFDGVIERSDVKAWLNHNPDRGILARCVNGEGTLELTVDEKGLKYRFEAPNTALGDELLEGLKRGDITGSSFAFTVSGEEWEKLEDDRYMRTITKFDGLYDVSPVYDPAYSQTTVAVRSLEKIKKQEEEEKRENKPTNNNTKSIFYL